MSNRKKSFALLTVSKNEKLLEILTFNDAEIISDNKYFGNTFMEDASNYLLDLKTSKNLEGVILDFYCHDDIEFLHKIRKYFSEFCESKAILFRLVYQNVIFTSMLLFHSDLAFTPEDTVYTIWIKNDSLVSYILKKSTLYFINEIKINNDFSKNQNFDKLLHPEHPPKFLVLGSFSSDPRLKQLKNQFKSAKTKVMSCTYEDCLKKSASHYLSRFIRAKDWRWNFKLSDSTIPTMQNNRPQQKSNTGMIVMAMIGFIFVATVAVAAFSNSPAVQSSIEKPQNDYIVKKTVKTTLTMKFGSTKIEIEIDGDGIIKGLKENGNGQECSQKKISGGTLLQKIVEWQKSVDDLMESMEALKRFTKSSPQKNKFCSNLMDKYLRDANDDVDEEVDENDDDEIPLRDNKIKGKNRSGSFENNFY